MIVQVEGRWIGAPVVLDHGDEHRCTAGGVEDSRDVDSRVAATECLTGRQGAGRGVAPFDGGCALAVRQVTAGTEKSISDHSGAVTDPTL
ncbi:hypothetical protein [Nocardia callitridis]|uniref:hypothetical protein n=1 Tax=Nocardia callitridis TaxID=648753 RepID=UPI0031E5C5B9